MSVSGVRRAWLSTIKQVRMVTALPQLHQNIQQTHLIHFASWIQDINIFHQDPGIPEVLRAVLNNFLVFIWHLVHEWNPAISQFLFLDVGVGFIYTIMSFITKKLGKNIRLKIRSNKFILKYERKSLCEWQWSVIHWIILSFHFSSTKWIKNITYLTETATLTWHLVSRLFWVRSSSRFYFHFR